MKAVKKILAISAVSAVAVAPSVFAFEAGDITFRFGFTQVSPDTSSDQVALNGTTLSLGGGSSTVDVDSNTQLGLTLEYFVSSTFGIELLAATPFSHTASGKGELAGLNIADVKHLPPTLSAVYHFNTAGAFDPYIGAGLNYTTFFSEDITSEGDTALTGLGLTGADVSLDDSFGLALQLGFDYQVNEKWLINASVRYIDISTTANIDFDSGDRLSVDVDIDPYVYTIAAGYKF